MSRFIPVLNLDEVIQDEAKTGLERAANSVASEARRIAPVATGDYRDSLRAVSDDDSIRAESDDFAAHLIEWGSATNPVYAPLRTAAAGVGRFEPK